MKDLKVKRKVQNIHHEPLRAHCILSFERRLEEGAQN